MTIVAYLMLAAVSFSISEAEKVLKPGDGLWGTWTPFKRCPNGSLASAFRLRIEKYQGFSILADDSGLNAIEIRCTDEREKDKITQILPHMGVEGEWTPYEETTCPDDSVITGVAIKSDNTGTFEAFKDNRGATDLKAICSDRSELTSTAALRGKHRGKWGEFHFCNSCFAVCGIRVRMADHGGDETALNGAQFNCCSRKKCTTNKEKMQEPNQPEGASREIALINHAPEPSETVTIVLVVVASLLVILVVMGIYWIRKMKQRRALMSTQMSDLVASANNTKDNIYCTLD